MDKSKRSAKATLEKQLSSARKRNARRLRQQRQHSVRNHGERRYWNGNESKPRLLVRHVAQLAEKQGGACAICGDTRDVLCVDHDHKTGRVRGMLCRACNLGIGCLGDDPIRLFMAASYLIKSGS